MSRLTLAAAAVALLAAAPANATMAEALSVDALASRADRIVEGRVLEIRSQWEGRLIVSDIVVGVDRCYKGACYEPALVVRVMGGAVGDLEQRVEGMASFSLDEPVLLFLRPDGSPDRMRTLGLAQGKFRLVPTGEGVEAVREARHMTLVGPGADQAEALEHVRLDVLVALVDRALDDAAMPELDVPPR